MNENQRKILLVLSMLVIIGAIILVGEPFKQQESVFPQVLGEKIEMQDNSLYPLAPEIIGISTWINSDELKLADLRGKVVLVDFWTYSCINCLRTLSYLKEWHEKYNGMGFVLIGVHSPEFEFEKVLSNVQQAVLDNEITWPVALDNDMDTWKNYKNRFWPAKYLVDAKGRIRFTHFGEGAYEETEKQIQLLLEETTGKEVNVQITSQETSGGVAGIFRTRELYAGYLRPGYLGNQQEIVPEQTNEFIDPKNHLEGLIYLHGAWFNSAEFVRHARMTERLDDYVAINYLASEVNVVLGGSEQGYKVFAILDGEKLVQRYAGKDIQFDGEGNAFIEVKKNRLYNVINGPIGKRELKLFSDSDEFTLYTFTFGG